MKKYDQESGCNPVRRAAERALSGDPLEDGRPLSNLIELNKHSRKHPEFKATPTDRQTEMPQDLGCLPVTTGQCVEECEEYLYALDEREHSICRRCSAFKE